MPPDTSFTIPQEWTFRDSAVAAGFERHVREQLPWYEMATGAVAHVARHYLAEAGTIYDLGASTGNIGRALAPTLEARKAKLISIEASHEMAALYCGPQPENLVIERIENIEHFECFDVAVAFLTMMFVPPLARTEVLHRLIGSAKHGGAIIIFDKCEAARGYAATVLWRLTLAGKVAAGVAADEIISKELSLMGVQRPIEPELFFAAAPRPLEFFRFGEFAGWLIET